MLPMGGEGGRDRATLGIGVKMRQIPLAAVGLLLALACVQVRAQQSGGSQGTPDQPIVIPSAVIGLDAAPEELREALDESKLPNTVPELLAELSKRARDIQATVSKGDFTQVWVPAMATKTVALVLESHTSSFPEATRPAANAGIKVIVTSAWELDTYGDLGDKAKIDSAYQRLASGVEALGKAYATR
jgi:hypothetical protein